MNLALSAFAIVPHDDGSVSIGNVTLDKHAAIDVATRIFEAAQHASADITGRVKCRTHLDRMFHHARIINVRDMATGYTAAVPAVASGDRILIRLADTTSATLLHEGDRCRGFAVAWRHDPLFGPVAELANPMRRYSCSTPSTKRLPNLETE